MTAFFIIAFFVVLGIVLVFGGEEQCYGDVFGFMPCGRYPDCDCSEKSS